MHDCSLCGSACYCHGDIDDCQVETDEYAYMNCDGCGCEADDFDDYPDEDCDDYEPFVPHDNSMEEYEMWLMTGKAGG